MRISANRLPVLYAGHKEMWAQGLRKQIIAMEEEKQQLEAKANEAASSLAQDVQMLKSKVEELQQPWWKRLR
jgi:predicted  nucleic acid-binding Zn-ribbon protein